MHESSQMREYSLTRAKTRDQTRPHSFHLQSLSCIAAIINEFELLNNCIYEYILLRRLD